MKLSIVIVNYNVEYFLEQCLNAVRKACKGIESEVFVVDNNSVDGSLRMLRNKFPEVMLISNQENVGFSRANNQAIKLAKGKYILLLNPDTVVEDDTFTKVIEFMDQHPDAGGLGVKMVDGQGKFLPESKRGLPTPLTAFYKIFGLSALFPRSRRFGRYHLGFLNENEIHKVEILAGAFMLLRKETLEITGLLDEAFFMYGEDIDLSYRIVKAGYSNYYYPHTRIIHYKGESTKKSSVNYVFVFYNAMIIFARKHFSRQRAKTFTALINIAIYFRAFLALASRFFKRIALPLSDALLGSAGLLMLKKLWGELTIYRDGGDYPHELVAVLIPGYMLLWLTSVYIAGGYDKPFKLKKSFAGLLAGTVLILLVYALLPEHYRFSRALILLGGLWMALSLLMNRLAGFFLKLDGFVFGNSEKKRFLLIGSLEETSRVRTILESTSIQADYIGIISTDEKAVAQDEVIGTMPQVPDIITIYKINEIVFCSKDVSHQTIIDKMTAWQGSGINYKIAPEDSLSIIGSNSINTRGDLYTIDIKAIDSIVNRRYKRLMDLGLGFLMLAGWPIIAMFHPHATGLLRNSLKVLIGRYSWVGYCRGTDNNQAKLPPVRKGVLCPADVFEKETQDTAVLTRLNLLYARDYHVMSDLSVFLKAFRKTGRPVRD